MWSVETWEIVGLERAGAAEILGDILRPFCDGGSS
jgi:hypothetical protein